MTVELEIRESTQAGVDLMKTLYPQAFPDEDLVPLVSDLLHAAPAQPGDLIPDGILLDRTRTYRPVRRRCFSLSCSCGDGERSAIGAPHANG